MKKQLYLLLCLTMVACNSKPHANTPGDSAKKTITAVSYSGPFDLAKLSLNEDLLSLMVTRRIKREQKDSLDKTMMGYEVFRSSDPKALRFENTDLSGLNGKNKNHVLFHYNEEKKTLVCYELKLYNQAQTDTLIGLLGKTGAIVFKRTKLPKGAIELDENGDEVKPGNSVRKTFRVWENQSTGISYFLTETDSGPQLTTELIVLKRATQFGKDWISTLQLDWYKNDKSEPL